MKIDLQIIVGIVILLFVFIILGYNMIIVKVKKIERNKSLVDIFLKKRYDLIPNLVEVCKGCSKYEQETLEKVTKLRSYLKDKDDSKTYKELNTIFNNLIALAESYPEIKASENYLLLQKEIVNVENEIQASRRIYINSVTDYNNYIMKFPTMLLAKVAGYKEIKFKDIYYEDVKINMK